MVMGNILAMLFCIIVVVVIVNKYLLIHFMQYVFSNFIQLALIHLLSLYCISLEIIKFKKSIHAASKI